MNVIGVDPEDKPYSPFIQKVVKPDQLDEVLPQADVVFISAPHTEKSHKMMGARQFELLKPNSYFVAVSRGGIYDMNALVKALDSKRLAGAGVDVTDPEPLPKGHPLTQLDNVTLVPHLGYVVEDSYRHFYAGTIEDIEAWLDGKPINVINPDAQKKKTA